MLITMRAVTVHEVPALVTVSQEHDFLNHLQQYVETERPRLVLDCSKVRRMDKLTMHLLLSCLEEAMKRNGDVRLASLSSEAEAALQLAGLHRLFETYASAAAAVHSYQQRPTALPPGLVPQVETPTEENAA